MTTHNKIDPLGPGYEGVAGKELRFRDVFRDTLRAEMNRDQDVFLMGEDISGGFDRDTQEPLDAWGGPLLRRKDWSRNLDQNASEMLRFLRQGLLVQQ